MSTHWKAILSAGAGIVSLAVVLSAATHRSQREAAPAPRGMTAQQTAVATSRGASASGSVIPAALPPAATTSSQAEAKDSAPAGLRRVEPQTVCMVNDRAMGKPQIPVEVDEKTYYGCCAMCKERLAQDEAVRYATDPVTGQRVDKASAVIAERPDAASSTSRARRRWPVSASPTTRSTRTSAQPDEGSQPWFLRARWSSHPSG